MRIPRSVPVVIVCLLAAIGIGLWIKVHARQPPDSMGLLNRFYTLMDQAATSGTSPDVSADICGDVSAEQLESLRAEVGNEVISYRPGVPGFWKSAKGSRWWTFSRTENFLWQRSLAIVINDETGDCAAFVRLDGF